MAKHPEELEAIKAHEGSIPQWMADELDRRELARHAMPCHGPRAPSRVPSRREARSCRVADVSHGLRRGGQPRSHVGSIDPPPSPAVPYRRPRQPRRRRRTKRHVLPGGLRCRRQLRNLSRGDLLRHLRRHAQPAADAALAKRFSSPAGGSGTFRLTVGSVGRSVACDKFNARGRRSESIRTIQAAVSVLRNTAPRF